MISGTYLILWGVMGLWLLVSNNNSLFYYLVILEMNFLIIIYQLMLFFSLTSFTFLLVVFFMVVCDSVIGLSLLASNFCHFSKNFSLKKKMNF